MDINHAAVEKIRTSAQKRAQNGSLSYDDVLNAKAIAECLMRFSTTLSMPGGRNQSATLRSLMRAVRWRFSILLTACRALGIKLGATI